MIAVVDGVLSDPMAYRQAALAAPFRSHSIGPATFHGIGMAPTDELPQRIRAHFGGQLEPDVTFLRQSPAGQVEPNYIHTDLDMGQWTGILYLTEHPREDDGTTFWRHKPSGAIQSTAATKDAWLEEIVAWRDDSQWEPWQTAPAAFNRLILFPAALFHSRSIRENYGEGEGARLIQIVFGKGDLASCL